MNRREADGRSGRMGRGSFSGRRLTGCGGKRQFARGNRYKSRPAHFAEQDQVTHDRLPIEA